MSRCQRIVQCLLAYVFASALVLAFASPGTMAHASSVSASAVRPSSCVAPPANFNPLNATKSQIKLYGLPPKPTKQRDLQHWVKIVSSAKHRTCSISISHSHMYSRPLPAHMTGTGGSDVTPNFSNGYSHNWSGYITGWGYGSGFDEAYGEWRLPCTQQPDPSGYHAVTWVGIGGSSDSAQDLLQAGTDNDPFWGRSLWWEVWPANYMQFISGFTPNCGDQIFSDVWVNYDALTSYYWIEDMSQSVYYSGQYRFVPDKQSAEWVDERPTCNGSITPLANFVRTNFTDAHVEVTGTSTYGTISSYRPGSITMTSSGGTIMAAPGSLNSAGDSFSDYWYDAGNGILCN